jgi:hypothetical protein
MLTSMEEVISVAGPELLSRERLGQALGAMQVWLPALLLVPLWWMQCCCCLWQARHVIASPCA